ncbi:MAG: phosphotransferase [Acidimicrobiia bacterium]
MNSVGRGAVDPDLSGSETLLTERVPAPVVAVIEAAGSRLTGLKAVQSSWWPGKQLTVRFSVSAEGGLLEGDHQIVATAGRIPDGAALVEGPNGAVGVWRVPNDPSLPGLPSALDRRTVSRLVEDMGIRTSVNSMRFRAYRPGRRGVVEAVGSPQSLFLKVVRPKAAKSLHEKHRHLSAGMPVPDSLGYSGNLGVVVLPAIPGADLRRILRDNDAMLPDPAAVAALIDDLPYPFDDSVTKSSIDKLPRVVDLLSRLVPSEADRLGQLVSTIGPDERDADVPVHGDFYEAQVLVRDGLPTGLIDVDTYGWGRPGDDPAMMLGHLTLLADGAPNPNRVLAFASRLQAIWEASLDPVDLRRRTAAVILGQATGPFRVQRPEWPSETSSRIDIAQRWVERSLWADKKSLILASGISHDRPRSLKS